MTKIILCIVGSICSFILCAISLSDIMHDNGLIQIFNVVWSFLMAVFTVAHALNAKAAIKEYKKEKSYQV